MKVKQVSIFIDNRAGRIARVARLLGDEQISIRAMSMADAPDFGIFRVIVDDPDRAVTVLKTHGFVVDVTDVVGVEVQDRPGGLADILEVLAKGAVNVEYMYAFLTEHTGRAICFFRFESPDDAIAKLRDAGVPLLTGESITARVSSRPERPQ